MDNRLRGGHTVSADSLVKTVGPLCKIADFIGRAQVARLNPALGNQIIGGNKRPLDIVDKDIVIVCRFKISVKNDNGRFDLRKT